VTPLLPVPDSPMTVARQRAAAGAWREVALLLSPHASEHGGLTEEAVLFCEAILYLGEERRALAFLRAITPASAPSTDRALYRRAVNMTGVASFAIGELEEANAALHAALDIATEDDDPLVLAQATNNLGTIANLQGRHEDALWHYRLAIPTLQRIGQRQRLANVYHNLGITFRDTGDLEEADEHERRAIEYATESAVPRLAAMGRTGRAEIALLRGDAVLAETTAQLVVEELKSLGDPMNEADAHRVVGTACAALQRYDDALAAFARALAIAREHGHALIEAESLRDRVDVRVRRGERDLALADARASIAIFEKLGATTECEALRERIAALG
jgi:tetratricopeptide (TPR) repeat protein